MGSAIKVHLCFSEPFWHPDAALYVGDGDIFTLELPSRFRDGVPPVINAFITGKTAEVWSRMSKEETIEHTLADICRMFQSDKPRTLFEKGMRSTWSDNPWIRGAYSFVPVGAFGARQILAEPVGNLFFAGEATVFESNPATVDGAIESGLRAAREICGTA